MQGSKDFSGNSILRALVGIEGNYNVISIEMETNVSVICPYLVKTMHPGTVLMSCRYTLELGLALVVSARLSSKVIFRVHTQHAGLAAFYIMNGYCLVHSCILHKKIRRNGSAP